MASTNGCGPLSPGSNPGPPSDERPNALQFTYTMGDLWGLNCVVCVAYFKGQRVGNATVLCVNGDWLRAMRSAKVDAISQHRLSSLVQYWFTTGPQKWETFELR